MMGLILFFLFIFCKFYENEAIFAQGILGHNPNITAVYPHQIKYVNINQYPSLVKKSQYSSNNMNSTNWRNTGYKFLQTNNKRICAEGM